MKLRTASLIAFSAAAAMALPAAPAGAAVTVGQTLPSPTSPPGGCSGTTLFQRSVTSGSDYVIPAGGGVITSWQHQGAFSTGEGASLVVGADAGGTSITIVARSPFVLFATGAFTSTPVRIPVAAGQRIGLSVGVPNYTHCGSYLPGSFGDQFASGPPDLQPGATDPFANTGAEQRVNVSATVEPDADGDGFGDESQDVTIASGPKKKTTKRKATFTFAGAGTFECRVDNGLFFDACSSPFKLKKLKPRKHTLRVRSTGPTGETTPETAFHWRVKK